MALGYNQLLKALAEQVRLLANACLQYDELSSSYGLEIAHRLRVIFHQTASSHSLVHQLGAQGNVFLSTIAPPHIMLYDSQNRATLPAFFLLKPIYGHQIFILYPRLDDHLMNVEIPYNSWWNNEVVASYAGENNFSDWKNVSGYSEPAWLQNGYSFTRKDLVLNYSNKLGGSHLDPNPSELLKYMIENGLHTDGFIRQRIDEEGNVIEVVASDESPFFGTIRQIAHEALQSFDNIYPGQLGLKEIYFEKIQLYRLIGHNKYIWKTGAAIGLLLRDSGNAITGVTLQNDRAIALGITSFFPEKTYEYMKYEFCILAESDGYFCALERGNRVSDFMPYNKEDQFGFLLKKIGDEDRILFLHNDKVFHQNRSKFMSPLTPYFALKDGGAKIRNLMHYDFKELNP